MAGTRGRRRLVGVGLAALCLAAASPVAGQAAPDVWTLSLEPYLWLAGADGTLRFELPPTDGGGTADVGTGSSALTWQAVAGLGYHLGWGDVRLAWRTIAYDLGEDGLLQGVTFSGAGIGVRFRI